MKMPGYRIMKTAMNGQEVRLLNTMAHVPVSNIQCAWCGSEHTHGHFDIIQHGFWFDDCIAVVKCQEDQCMALTAQRYLNPQEHSDVSDIPF